jgi:flagellar assembly protein FliH
MSSRILNRGAAVNISPMIWSTADSAAQRKDFGNAAAGQDSTEAETLQHRLAELKIRVEAETAAAYQRGFQEGEARANAAAADQVQAAVLRMAKSVAEAAALRPRLRQQAESDVVQLALAIARKVLRREMSIDPSAMQALVKVALEKLERHEICRLYVHPQQAAAVRAALDSHGAGSVEVTAEMARDEGSLVFETNRGKLDASVSAQLEEIERGLTDRVAHS